MADLSYDALTIANAFLSTPLTPDPQQSALNALGAALRAAAHQLSEELEFYNAKVIDVEDLLAIAVELEGQ